MTHSEITIHITAKTYKEFADLVKSDVNSKKESVGLESLSLSKALGGIAVFKAKNGMVVRYEWERQDG
jgi:hypothetical protein